MKSKKSIKSILLMSVLAIISLFFINMSLAANTAKVSVETANLRETTDEGGKILEQLSQGQEVEVLEKQENWYKVKAKGITGYVRSDLITLQNEMQENNTINNTTTAENKIEENVQSEENKVIDTEEDIKTGKYKIGKDTKLKIVPVINATDIIEVKENEEVTVTEVINDWVCVETQNTKGWIRKENLKKEETQNQQVSQPEEKEETSEETIIKTLYVNTETANLRKEASTTSEIVTTLNLNSAVNVVSEENGWSKVKVGDKEGFISSSLLSEKRQETSRSRTTVRSKETSEPTNNVAKAVPTSGNGSSVVTTANQYIGSKYVYGGTTPSGFDCSGFTSYVYKQYGVNLNRTAAGQYSNGVAVSKSELQPGDLVMFGKSGINHVGIYVGGGKMVHAANSSRGVTTDTINSGYYGTNYVGARRVL